MQSVYLERITNKNAAKGYKKTKPIQTQFLQRPKMNVNLFATKDYDNVTAFRLQKNKPNQSQSVFLPPSNESMFISKTVKKSCAREGRLIEIDLKHSFLSAVADYGSAFYFEFYKTEPRP